VVKWFASLAPAEIAPPLRDRASELAVFGLIDSEIDRREPSERWQRFKEPGSVEARILSGLQIAALTDGAVSQPRVNAILKELSTAGVVDMEIPPFRYPQHQPLAVNIIFAEDQCQHVPAGRCWLWPNYMERLSRHGCSYYKYNIAR